jgi:hypothetical protein
VRGNFSNTEAILHGGDSKIITRVQILIGSDDTETQRFVQWLRLALFNGPNTVSLPLTLRTETDPVSETFCSLEYRTMDKIQKFSNHKFI